MNESSHAVVIGGSFAGLCAARVLGDHFADVTVIERDVFSSDPQAHRKGVPQSRHPHVLLDGGRRELERLFPGFGAECLARGALDLDPGREIARLLPEGWAPARVSPRRLLFASRVLTESVIRDWMSKSHGLQIVEGTDVVGLLADTSAGVRIRGVRTRAREGGEIKEIEADLVVDASGRSTGAPEWLAELGLAAPAMTVVDADAGYSTRWYQGPAGTSRPADWWWKSLFIEPIVEGATRPEDQYMGVLIPIEQDCWIVTIGSWGGTELASDPESFERVVAGLRSPILAEAIARAEPISPVYHRRAMQNSWRHYEKWPPEVAGFIASGDAVCGFNPVYGQGISSAALCAAVLRTCLERESALDASFPRRFFREQAAFLETPWMMATSRDKQQARIEGDADAGQPTSRMQQLARRFGAFYFGQLAAAAGRDAVLGQSLFDVANLSRTPASLMRDPRLLVRALLARLRQKVAQGSETDSEIPERPPPPPA